jgi:hypothetical protein
MTAILQHYDYRPRLWSLVCLFAFVTPGTILLAYFASTADGPQMIKGVQWTAAEVTVLYTVGAVVASIGCISIAFLILVAAGPPTRVALTTDAILLPRPTRIGFSREEISIPLDAFVNVSVEDFIGSTKVLRILHGGGTIFVPSNMLASRARFDELCAAVVNAIQPSI